MPSCWLKHPHASKSERAYCNYLRARHLAEEIASFRIFPSIKLHVKRGNSYRIWKIWKADFEVTELDGSISIHESKGWNRSNDAFRLKAHAFLKEYPKIPLFVNRVKIPADSKRFAIPGLKVAKPGGAQKEWLRNNYHYDSKLKRYVKNEK